MNGFDPKKAPAIVSVVNTVFDAVQGVVRVHATPREGDQMHTSLTDGMASFERLVEHTRQYVLMNREPDCGPEVSANLQFSMRSGRAYTASKKILSNKGIRHGILPASQASLSIISTIKPVTPDATTSAMSLARSVFGPGIDLEGVI